MKKEDLVKKLNELPEGTEVYLFDYRKTKLDDSEMLSNFDVELIEKSEIVDENVNSFAVISFE